jgi:apolipoprotein D and lipocalin family protein
MDARSLLCWVALAAVLPQGTASVPPPRTAPSLDPRLYAGTYYEIARFPNPFQKQCAGDVTATYAVRGDGRLDVVNRCRKEDGTVTEARGVARRAAGDATNAKLEVRFAPAWLSLITRVWGSYWVLAVGPQYSYAVVGDPQRNYLWILSRLRQMPPLAYQQALEIARSNGYDVSRLVRTPQGP